MYWENIKNNSIECTKHILMFLEKDEIKSYKWFNNENTFSVIMGKNSEEHHSLKILFNDKEKYSDDIETFIEKIKNCGYEDNITIYDLHRTKMVSVIGESDDINILFLTLGLEK